MNPAFQLLTTMRESARPIQIAMLVLALTGVIEAFVVARLGSAALRTYASLLPLLFAADALGYALGASAVSVFSRTVSGQSRVRQVFLGGVVGLCVGVLLTGIASGVYSVLPSIDAEAETFVGLYALFLPVLLLNHLGLALLRATNRAGICAKTLCLGASIHLAVLVAIETRLFLPLRSIEGLAYAYVFSTTTVGGLLIAVLRSERYTFDLVKGLRECIPFLRELWPILWKSVLSNLLTPISIVITISLLAAQGDAYVEAYSLALKIEVFALVSFLAYSSVIGPLAGRLSLEQKRITLTPFVPCFRHCYLRGLLVASILGLLQYVLPLVLKVCNQTSVQLLQFYLLVVPVSYGAYGIFILTSAISNALGYPAIGLVVSFLRTLGVFLPAVYLFQMFSLSVFTAIAVSNFIAAGAGVWWLRRILGASDSGSLWRAFAKHYPAI